MQRRNIRSGRTTQLRRQAEKIVSKKAALSTEDLEALSPEETRQLIHELRVHQVELEMQNQELLRTQVELDAMRERYFDLYNLAPVGYVSVNENGLILEANLTIGTLLGISRRAMIRLPFSSFIFQEDQDSYYLHRKQLFKTGVPQSCELRMVKKDGTEFWAQVECTVAGNADGAHRCRITVSNISERKRAEKKILESQAFLSNLLDSIPVPVFYKDIKGLYRDFNQSFEKFFGKTKDELIGKSVFDINPHELAQIYHANDRELLSHSGIQVYESQVRDAHTVLHDVVFHKATMINPHGEIIGLVGAILDITKRKRAEKALKDSAERQRAILQTAMDGFWMADMQGRLLEVNETYCRMSGYSAQELLTMSISDLDIIETPADTLSRIQRIRMQGEDRFESRHRRKDGSIFDVEVSVQHRRCEGGRNVAFLRDITQQKQAAEALHQANAILQTAMNQSAAGIAIADAPEGTLRYVNDAGLRIRGGTRETIVNKIGINQYVDIWQLLDLDGRPLKTDEVPLARAILFGETFSREFIVRRMDGNNRVVLANAAPIRNAKGHITAAVVVFLDITERKRMKNTLRLLSSQLLTSREEEQQRIAMELHDQTGQDLNVLKLYLGTLKSRLRKDQAGLKAECDQILTYTDRIIEEVRRLAHGLNPSQLDTLGLCAALKALIRTFSEETRIPIRFDIDALDKAFPSKTEIVLYRIFQEALTNIYKHARAQSVRIDVRRHGDALAITIKDDGQGFHFDRIGRGDPSAERGMGLSTMELRAQMIHAELKISSRPDEGTEICLLVPVPKLMAKS